MAGIIDIHTHAFPDPIAAAAIPALEKEGNIKAYLNGTVSALLASMDRSGIEQSVLCSIATRPEQFDTILEWSTTIRSERIIPFPSLHPRIPNCSSICKSSMTRVSKGSKCTPTISWRNAKSKAECFRGFVVALGLFGSARPDISQLLAVCISPI